VGTGKIIILRTLRGMSTFEFLPRITFEGNVLKKRIFSNPGKREDSRDKYLHEIRFKKTRNEFLISALFFMATT
jgi:hypothetical protein